MNIFLFGRACSGKDEVARRLWSRHGYRWFALAEAVKSEFGRWYGHEPKRADRAKVIEIAESYKRIYSPTVWVDSVIEDIAGRDREDDQQIVISDGRFLVEYKAFVQERSFVPILVHAPASLRIERMISRDGIDQTAMIGDAEDEIDLMPFEHMIYNDGTLDDLHEQVDYFVERIRR